MKVGCIAVLTVLVCVPGYAGPPQDSIQEITFDTIPGNTSLIATSGSITLDGSVSVTQDFAVVGIVESTTGGYRFPDGTIQTTAAAAATSSPELATATTNTGQYDNRIIEYTPALAVTEVCFKAGSVSADIHAVPETTAGGNCLPGDVGWTVERDERPAETWEIAKAECLMAGMRLPEPFEFAFSCRNEATFGINDMANGNHEWASNSAEPQIFSTFAGVGSPMIGLNGCSSGSWGWVNRGDNFATSTQYRCVR